MSSPLPSFLITSSFWGRTVLISDLSKSTNYYKVAVRVHKPHYTFADTTGSAIATASTNPGKGLEFVVNGRVFNIEIHSSLVACEFVYKSPAMGGREIVWNSAQPGPVGEIVCTDPQTGQRLGRFMQRTLYKEMGTLDFEDEIVKMGKEVVDEMVVVGLALAWLRITQSSVALVAASKAVAVTDK